MGGSESRCCADSEQKSPDNIDPSCAYVTQPGIDGTPLRTCGLAGNAVDPRSPSSSITRTPIEIRTGPTIHPKPLMRVKPMSDTGMLGNNDKDVAVGSSLNDPRSPAPGVRTPISFDTKSYDLMIDPRSPTEGIVRTPLLTEPDTDFASKADDADEVFQTPKGVAKSKENIISINSDSQLFDPRSPSQNIQRTPVSHIQEEDECAVALKSLKDPRSPTNEIYRSPLNSMLSGRRELRRAVLMTNAIMASPLAKGMAGSNSYVSQSPASDDSKEELRSAPRLDLLQIPTEGRRDSAVSRTSSMVAVFGSDVDCMNLDDSVDISGEEPSDFGNAVNTTDGEVADDFADRSDIEIEGPIADKVEAQTEQQMDITNPEVIINNEQIQQVQPANVPPLPSILIDDLPAAPENISKLYPDSDISSVRSDDQYVTAKLAAVTSEEEYCSAQDVSPSYPTPITEHQNVFDFKSTLHDDGDTSDINYITTYAVLETSTPILTEHVDGIAVCGTEKDDALSQECGLEKDDALSQECGTKKKDALSEEHVGESIKESGNENPLPLEAAVEETCHQTSSYEEVRDSSSNNDVAKNASQDSEVSSEGDGLESMSSMSRMLNTEMLEGLKSPRFTGKKKPRRRLRTPKPVKLKRKSIGEQSEHLSPMSSDLEPVSENAPQDYVGKALNSKVSDVKTTTGTTLTRSPLAVLNNDCKSKLRKNTNSNTMTKLPRYRSTAKPVRRSLSASHGNHLVTPNTLKGDKEN